jgi:hypothetical protein
VQVRIFHGDRQAEARPTDRSGTRSVAPPKAVENLPSLTSLEPHPMVTDRYRNGRVVGLDQDVNRMTLAVLDRVDQEVAENPFDPSSVDLGLGLPAFMHGNLGLIGLRQSLVGLYHPIHQIA